MIFVNLPVTDLPASRDFYTGLGFESRSRKFARPVAG